MQVLTPSEAEMRTIQEREGVFYFSKCFRAVMDQYGIIAGHDEHSGPGIVLRGFSDLDQLDPNRPLIFEGALTPELITSQNLDIEEHEAEELYLTNEDSSILEKMCFKSLTVRTIPPVGSEEQHETVPHVPEDPRWQPESFLYQVFTPSDEAIPVLYAMGEDGEKYLVGIKKGNWIFLGVPIIGVIIQLLSCPPIFNTSYYGVNRYCDHRRLWLLLEDIIHKCIADTSVSYLKVSLWPAGKKSSYCVRHDYDRPMSREELEQLLIFYKEHGVKSTWFWRVCEAEKSNMARVSDYDHELALHTETDNYNAFLDDEIRFFQDCCGYEMLGYSAHGGKGSAGYLGQLQFDWAQKAGLVYGEILSIDSGLPYPGISIRDDLPEIIDLWIPGTHYSIDRGTAPEAYDIEGPREYCEQRIERGEQIVIMNHPDIHLEPLKKLVSETVQENMWHATLLESAKWCRQRSGLRARYLGDGVFELTKTERLDHDIEVWIEGGEMDEIKPFRLNANFDRVRFSKKGIIETE